jgi:hypothetical protein
VVRPRVKFKFKSQVQAQVMRSQAQVKEWMLKARCMARCKDTRLQDTRNSNARRRSLWDAHVLV